MKALSYSLMSVILFVLLVAAGLVGRIDTAVYNLHLVTDNVPDYTDLESFVQSVTGHLDTPQEKCIAVWRWGRRSQRQTSCSRENGRLIWDPILHYNSHGTMNCGIISALNMVSWFRLGYQSRYVQLGDRGVFQLLKKWLVTTQQLLFLAVLLADLQPVLAWRTNASEHGNTRT